jgi:hypothetical protein
MSVSGCATNINKTTNSFDIIAYQYSGVLGSARKMPLLAQFPTTGKYARVSKKPMPSNNALVSVSGYLKSVEWGSDDQHSPEGDDIKTFKIAIEGIAKLGLAGSGIPGDGTLHRCGLT